MPIRSGIMRGCRQLRRLIFCGIVVLVSASGTAQIPADLAAGNQRKIPIPTFGELHTAYFRIVVNESGWINLADQDGILQALINCGGGRAKKKNFYGLDPSKLMRQMVRHSTRTFPPYSKFLGLRPPQREAFKKSQTKHNGWVAHLQTSCAKPIGWPEKIWRSKYGKRCRKAVRTTRLFLTGKTKTRCNGKPTTWGSHEDTIRPGGPLDRGWKEIVCDRPTPEENCKSLSRKDRLNSTRCAQNRFWTWREKESSVEQR